MSTNYLVPVAVLRSLGLSSGYHALTLPDDPTTFLVLATEPVTELALEEAPGVIPLYPENHGALAPPALRAGGASAGIKATMTQREALQQLHRLWPHLRP